VTITAERSPDVEGVSRAIAVKQDNGHYVMSPFDAQQGEIILNNLFLTCPAAVAPNTQGILNHAEKYDASFHG
jgi:hypothetical protein